MDAREEAGRRPDTSDLPRVPRVKLLLARASLLWERLWPALLRPMLLLGFFLTVAFLDLLPLLPPWLHVLLLLFFLLAFAGLLYRGLRSLKVPDQTAAQRRLEQDSGLTHRPLASLEDEPALSTGEADDPTVTAYWALHRRRLQAQLDRLRVSGPRAGWSRVDGRGLRALVGLPLLVALVIAGGDWDGRLLRAAVPGTMTMEQVPPARLDAWISPPAYTGAPPLYLDPEEDTELRVPAGSRLLAQVQGGQGEPEIALAGEPLAAFTAGGENLFRTETQLEVSGNLSVEQRGKILGTWDLEVLRDLPPEAEYLSAPSRSARGAVQFEYAVADDYGVESLVAIITRRDAAGEGESMELPLPLPSRHPREAEGRSFQDLTPHPWAGIEVSITLEARDAAGQAGQSEAFETVLPARVFNHPVARRLAELRRHLTQEPEARHPVAQELDSLAQRPEHYFNDFVVSLGILSASQRLLHDRSAEAVPSVQSLLWDLALRIEEGEQSIVERELRELQEQLQEALAQDAPQEEIERLMSELQEKMEQFLQSMMEEAMEGLQDMPEMPSDAELMSSQDLQQLLDEARELARSGAREQAQQLLSELQRMLENLQANPQQADDMNQRLQQSRELMQDLQDMMRQQQELLDRSFQRNQQGEMRGAADGEEGQGEDSPGRAPGSAEGDAAEQEDLRRALGEMMRRSGEMTGSIPRPLGQAEQEMRAAREALEQGSSGQALGPQGQALDHLQQGMEALLEDFAQQLGQGQEGEGPGMGAAGEGERDPLGRQRGRGGYLQSGEGVELPDEAVLQRAREILNELRRRSGERHRPEIELEYFKRLLRQF